MLQLHHLGGDSKCAVQSDSHSFRVTCNQSAVSLPQSREWHYSKAIDILSRNVWNVVLLDAGCTPHLAKTFSQNVKVELVAHDQLYPCTFLCACTKVWIHYMLNYFLFCPICSLTILLSFFHRHKKINLVCGNNLPSFSLNGFYWNWKQDLSECCTEWYYVLLTNVICKWKLNMHASTGVQIKRPR